MNKQDTFDKLQHGVHAGMQLKHMFRGKTGYGEFDWFATITNVNAATNTLRVKITSKPGGPCYFEDWNMEHTLAGINRGEYLEITCES